MAPASMNASFKPQAQLAAPVALPQVTAPGAGQSGALPYVKPLGDVPPQMAPPLPYTGSPFQPGPVPNINAQQTQDQTNQIIQQFMSSVSSMMGGGNTEAKTNDPSNPWSGTGAYGRPEGAYGNVVHEDYSQQMSHYSPPNTQDVSQVAGFDCDRPNGNRIVCMACNIYFEAGKGEPFDAQVEVGRTVMSRVFSGAYPDRTVCGTVYRHSGSVAQYSWTLEKKSHVLPQGGDALKQVISAAENALREGPDGFTNYYNYHIAHPPWGEKGSCAATAKYFSGSQHRFCKISGSVTFTVAQIAAAEHLQPSQLGLAQSGEGLGAK